MDPGKPVAEPLGNRDSAPASAALAPEGPSIALRALHSVLRGLCIWRVPLSTLLYALWAAGWTLCVALEFFSSLQWQLFMAEARAGKFGELLPWSAPLDDVFIHFDFARSAARGFPFQWSEGNGYSSGGTSLLYPFVLALGYRLGYDELQLMHWAGVVACLSVWGCLLWGRSLCAGLPGWCSWLLPPVLLSVGALNWSLFSGMEVAFFLCVWAWCVAQWNTLLSAPTRQGAALFGLACAVLVATRPEAAVLVAVFSCALFVRALPEFVRASTLLLLSAVPGALIVAAQTLANRLFTGESSAAGALVKLEMHHPYLSSAEKWTAWQTHLKYQVMRVTEYHFADLKLPLPGAELSAGWLVWVLAVVGLLFRGTRRAASLLWVSMLAWVFIVATNGQVRWQNERYTMPAAAWLLLAAALGLGVIFSQCLRTWQQYRGSDYLRRRGIAWSLASLAALAACVTFVVVQAPQYRGQLWFFGRASRNIWEQHIAAADKVRQLRATRVLVGDAGAIPYVADIPALDIIGLGGYHDLPFARATRMSVAAGVELIQRLPPEDRPDLLAIYPGWWGELPAWFGTAVAEFPVRGNVICGGPSKVLYVPNWNPLDNSRTPFALKRGEQVRSELDFADLLSEEPRRLQLRQAPGFVGMKLLPHPTLPKQDAWDAGRILPVGGDAQFVLDDLRHHQPLTLVLRLAPTSAAALRITVGGYTETLQVLPNDEWQEPRIVIPGHVITQSTWLQLQVLHGELVLYHLWGVQTR